MKLTFLGTAHPPYGYKKTDLLATALLIDGHLLVLPTEDIFRFTALYALPELTEGIDAVLVTASHPRTFSPYVIERLSKQRPLTLFASDAVGAMCRHIDGVTHIPLHATRTVTDGRLRLTPLPSGYTTPVCAEDCFTVHISDGCRALYFGVPCGNVTEEAQRALAEQPVDAALLDVAYASGEGDLTRHLSLSAAVHERERLRSIGALRGRGYTMLTSLPPFPSPEERSHFIEEARGHGFLVPYDGYFLDL